MINSKLYDILKWVALICIPALVIAIPNLFAIWGIPYGEQIGETLQVIAVLLGTLLGVSNVHYVEHKDDEQKVVEGNVEELG